MTLPITIFSDFSCPFSFLAEKALRGLDREDVSVIYRAAPSGARRDPPDDDVWVELLEAARQEGIEMRMPAMLPATEKAHEAALFARKLGAEEALRTAIFTACWGEGADIGRIDVLMRLAGSVGLDPEELKIALDIDLHTEAVAADAHTAQRLGIRQTPVTYFGSGSGAKVVAGAYTSAQLRALLDSGDLFTAGING